LIVDWFADNEVRREGVSVRTSLCGGPASLESQFGLVEEPADATSASQSQTGPDGAGFERERQGGDVQGHDCSSGKYRKETSKLTRGSVLQCTVVQR
jgi:hypothetical protein